MVSVDVRTIPPRDRHAAIFRILAELSDDDCLRVTSDHDPRPLRLQVEAEYPGRFAWQYCPSVPELWVVEVRRIAAAR